MRSINETVEREFAVYLPLAIARLWREESAIEYGGVDHIPLCERLHIEDRGKLLGALARHIVTSKLYNAPACHNTSRVVAWQMSDTRSTANPRESGRYDIANRVYLPGDSTSIQWTMQALASILPNLRGRLFDHVLRALQLADGENGIPDRVHFNAVVANEVCAIVFYKLRALYDCMPYGYMWEYEYNSQIKAIA